MRISIPLLLVLTLTLFSADGSEPPVYLSKTIGDLEFVERTDYEQKGAGYSLRYQTKDLLKADVYVYDMGIRNLPDGVAFTGTRISDTFLLSHRGHFLKVRITTKHEDLAKHEPQIDQFIRDVAQQVENGEPDGAAKAQAVDNKPGTADSKPNTAFAALEGAWVYEKILSAGQTVPQAEVSL